ncbi:helix-turn-helix domain-containing protein [uncultured Paludibaculum sp.]|uniref:helix-turn-helix domain-containing protein n=1 Tax=uncultured Paludibaculum sp. TaxID=1765020 RepID=UPI002AAB7980|nr:helix-turn-helix domain-containing protein [uncultured Paludibaculum sp.]
MDAPAPEEVLAQVKRILADPGFSTSDPMRNVLLYLATHGVTQPGKPVKEFEIATNALGRGDDYDPRSDSTVRVVASRLRSKLAEYYTQDGVADPVIISIPKGAYVVSGSYRHNGHSNGASNGAGRGLGDSSVSRRAALAAGLAAIAGGVGGFLFGRHTTKPEVAWPVTTFWHEFLDPEAPIIVFSNPKFHGTAATGLRLPPFAPGSSGPESVLYTGTGEVMAVRDISRMLSRLGVDARVKRAQLFTWDDAGSSDLIFVGGQEQNEPMAQLPKLEKFNLKPESQAPTSIRGAVVNASPQAGEEAFYVSSEDLENGTEYAIVALTHGVTPDKRILLLAGVRTLGTEGAAAAICNPTILEEILQKLGVTAGGVVPSFEALFEFRIRGGAPLDPKLRILHRRNEHPAS